MDQEKNTLPVTAPVSTEQYNSDIKRTDSSSSKQAYMFDKMNNLEEAEYDEANDSRDDKNSIKKSTLYQKYRTYFQ